MQKLRTAIAGILALFVVSAAVAQQFPTVPDHTVIGRIGSGTGSGPSQAIPFDTITTQLGVTNYLPVFNVANYATPQLAVAAAITAKGGIVYFPCGTYSLGSGIKGIDLDDVAVPIRLSGPANAFGGPANKCLQLFYHGTGTAISARSSTSFEMDHIVLYNTVCATKVLDLAWSATGGDSDQTNVHDNTFGILCASSSNLLIDLADVESVSIARNRLAPNTGTAIRGVAPGRNFSVKVTIKNNMFGQGTATAISSPGQNWTVDDNTAQAPTAAFIAPGPVNTCTVLNVRGNWIGDFTGGINIVQSNCWSLVSQGNEYANGPGAANITQTNSTGTVTSIGDRHDGTTAINIGTGNALLFSSPMKNSGTVVVSGTPDTSLTGLAVYGSFGLFAPLSVNASGSALLSAPTGMMLGLNNANATDTTIAMWAYGTSVSNYIRTFQARGTRSAPTAVQSGDVLFNIVPSGFGTTGFTTASGSLAIIAAENFTDTAKGSIWGISTVTPGTTTSVQRMQWGLGVTVPPTVTGGDKGAGTINALNYYRSNVPIAQTASAPLVLTTGDLTCPTCVILAGTAHGDSNYTILSTDRYVYTNAAFTAARTWTLPAASSLPAGTTILVADSANGVTSTNSLTIARAGADTIDGILTSLALTNSTNGLSFTTDGVSNWGSPSAAVNGGGTGRGALTNHGVLVGAGSNPVTQLAVAATGTVLRGQTGADPVFGAVNMATDMTGTMLAAQEPAHTGDVTNSAGSLALTLAAGSASVLNSGTLPAARMPALTGDCTTSVGAVATTCTKINGVDQTTAWTTYTPTITAQTGTITSLTSNSGRYKQIGKTILLQIDVQINNPGSGAGAISATLPFTAAAFPFVGGAREINITGNSGASTISASGTTVAATPAAPATITTFIGTNNRIVMGITYEIP